MTKSLRELYCGRNQKSGPKNLWVIKNNNNSWPSQLTLAENLESSTAPEEDTLPKAYFKCGPEGNGQGMEEKAGTVEDKGQGGGPREQN